MLWIRIRSNRRLFLPDSDQERDRHPGSAHPDPDPYPFFLYFKPELKLNYTVPYLVPENLHYTVRHRGTVQNSEIITPLFETSTAGISQIFF